MWNDLDLGTVAVTYPPQIVFGPAKLTFLPAAVDPLSHLVLIWFTREGGRFLSLVN